VAYDADTAWVISPLTEVDTTTGDRSSLSGGGVSTGAVGDMAFDGTSLLAVGLADVLVEIDPTDGTRTLRSGFPMGSGPLLDEPTAGAWDASTARFVAAGGPSARLIAVDLGDGVREGVSGAVSTHPEDVEIVGDIAYVAAPNGFVSRVDLVAGTDAELTSASVGSGPPVGNPRGVAARPTDPFDVWFVTATGAVMHVDPDTGDRTLIADDTTGAGPSLSGASDILYDPSADRLLVIVPPTVYEVDLTTGDRTELSGQNVGSGPYFGAVQASVDGESLYVCTFDGWGVIDLTSGDRTRISDYNSPGPHAFFNSCARSDTGQLVTADHQFGAVVVTSPLTGERVIVSK
jgi:hypothetical protein